MFRAAAIYGAVAWGVTEDIVTIVEQLFPPPWVATLTVIFFVVSGGNVHALRRLHNMPALLYSKYDVFDLRKVIERASAEDQETGLEAVVQAANFSAWKNAPWCCLTPHSQHFLI